MLQELKGLILPESIKVPLKPIKVGLQEVGTSLGNIIDFKVEEDAVKALTREDFRLMRRRSPLGPQEFLPDYMSLYSIRLFDENRLLVLNGKKTSGNIWEAWHMFKYGIDLRQRHISVYQIDGSTINETAILPEFYEDQIEYDPNAFTSQLIQKLGQSVHFEQFAPPKKGIFKKFKF